MKISVISKAYQDIKKFNDIAENLINVDSESIALQLDLIQEEYIETVDAFDAGDTEGILDGSIDMFVVICGLLQKLEAQGYDVAEGIKRVCDNNSQKFPSLDAGCAYNQEFELSVNEKYNVYVIRDKNGKIRKPEGFVSVDLSDCVPKGE